MPAKKLIIAGGHEFRDMTLMCERLEAMEKLGKPVYLVRY